MHPTMAGPRVEPRDHLVHLYEEDGELVTDVAAFFAEGISKGEVAIVVATSAHRVAIEEELERCGTDPSALIVLDAAEALASFMVDGAPHAQLFRATIGNVIEDASTLGRGIRAFGEMVALLWDAGHVTQAIELEELWNSLAREFEFSLYCAYRLSSLTGNDDVIAANHVCAAHSDLVVPDGYGLSGGVSSPDSSLETRLFVPATSAIAGARAFVGDVLQVWGSDGRLIADATIVMSELASNAVRHARSAFRITLSREGSRIRMEVDDADATVPAQREVSHAGTGGLGLKIVESLCARYGVEERAGGKVVWAEFAPTTT
jgi:anti-sigma regulatory factor (Ser/Thr protein kinase)